MTNFSKKIPLARDSTPDDPRSYWDRLLMEEAAAKVRSAKLPQPDPNTKFKVTTMAPAISMAQGRSSGQEGTTHWQPAPKGGRPPESVMVDPSCYDVPGVFDPEIQAAMLEAMRYSLNHAPGRVAEYGFFSSPKRFGTGHSPGPIFTDNYADQMRQQRVDLNRPGRWESLWNGNYEPDAFIHTHPNYDPPSPVGKVRDPAAAEHLKIPVMAIDKGGNVTCVLPPGWVPKR
ncbi:hypothetical protein [Rhizorhabdus wittichii]|uniref:hypothetical protein n=1 Tax=Rhizorhabdus wittichii TaxID=160791 RepID=UPI0012FE63F2|nr:hypothetical protein [Rhizorhabdus wittichii]